MATIAIALKANRLIAQFDLNSIDERVGLMVDRAVDMFILLNLAEGATNRASRLCDATRIALIIHRPFLIICSLKSGRILHFDMRGRKHRLAIERQFVK